MKNTKLVLAVLVVLILIAGVFYYFHTHSMGNSSSVASTTAATTTPANSATGSKASSVRTPASPATPQSFAPSLNGVSLSATPTSGVAPFTTKFLGTFPSSLNGSYTFSMTYGDGTAGPVQSSCVGTACTASVSHTYSISGSFVPELSATTKCATIVPVSTDCPHTTYVIAKVPVTVTGGESSASLVVSPTPAKVGESVNLLIKGSGSSLKVDFGDGTTDSLAPMTAQSVSIDHTYAKTGTYVVKITSGTETLASQNIIIQIGS